jgi:hypothetical protein
MEGLLEGVGFEVLVARMARFLPPVDAECDEERHFYITARKICRERIIYMCRILTNSLEGGICLRKSTLSAKLLRKSRSLPNRSIILTENVRSFLEMQI